MDLSTHSINEAHLSNIREEEETKEIKQ